MKTFTQTSNQIRKKLFEMDNENAREASARNYLQKLHEFNIKSITELNEEELHDFIKSLRVIEG